MSMIDQNTYTPNSGWPMMKAEVLPGYQPALDTMAKQCAAMSGAFTAMGTEWLGFINRRIQLDLSLSASLAKCSNPQDFMQTWLSFVTTAAEDYRAEFVRLSEINSDATQQAASAFQPTGGKQTGGKPSTRPGL